MSKCTTWHSAFKEMKEECDVAKKAFEKKKEECETAERFLSENYNSLVKEREARKDLEKTLKERDEGLQAVRKDRENMEAAIGPIIEMVNPDEPPSAGNIIERLKQIPQQIQDFCNDSLRNHVNKLVAVIKAYNPAANLEEITELPEGTTYKQFESIVEETKPIADKFMSSLSEEQSS